MGLNDHIPVHTPSTESDRTTLFTTFMRAYQDMVFSTAARLTGNDAQAEDIAQEVFIKAYENFAHLRESPAAGGWLKTVAINLALNHLTRYRKRWRFFSEESSLPEPQLPDTLLADLGADQQRAVIDDALRRLPEHRTAAAGAFSLRGVSYEDIAVRLGVTLSKVKTDIRRARAALLPVLQAQGIARDSLES